MKPVELVIDETVQSVVEVLNHAQISLFDMKMVLQRVFDTVEAQTQKEIQAYQNSLKESEKKDEKSNKNS